MSKFVQLLQDTSGDITAALDDEGVVWYTVFTNPQGAAHWERAPDLMQHPSEQARVKAVNDWASGRGKGTAK